MPKIICSLMFVALSLCAIEPSYRAVEASQNPQVWVWSGFKIERESRHTTPSRLSLTLAQRLTIDWDGMTVEPESVRDQGNGRIEWQGNVGSQWYLVRMSISDDYQRVRLDYDVLAGRGGRVLHSGVANLTREFGR